MQTSFLLFCKKRLTKRQKNGIIKKMGAMWVLIFYHLKEGGESNAKC